MSMLNVRHSRVRRQLLDLNIASNKRIFQSHTEVKGNNNNVSQWPNGSDSDLNSDGLKTVNRVLQDGSDLLGAPSRWIKDMQQNWFGYILLTAILLICALFFYCLVRYHCSRRRTTSIDKFRLDELASIKPAPLTTQTNQP